MKLFKWGSILILSGVLALGVLTLHPDTVSQLTTNFRKNLIRSFKDSGMQTQLKNLDLSIWPPLIKWSFLKIARPKSPDLPNSWVQIFKKDHLISGGQMERSKFFSCVCIPEFLKERIKFFRKFVFS